MSDTKHTPGPWAILDDKEPSAPGIEAPSVEFSVVVIGYPQHDAGDDAGVHGRTPEEKMANACLIAAAPDMLQALDWIRDGVQTALDEAESPSLDALVLWLAHSEAAIAKAKGEGK
jgi:hypothetical protein